MLTDYEDNIEKYDNEYYEIKGEVERFFKNEGLEEIEG